MVAPDSGGISTTERGRPTQKCNGCFPLNTLLFLVLFPNAKKKIQIKDYLGKFCFEMDHFIFILASDFLTRRFYFKTVNVTSGPYYIEC